MTEAELRSRALEKLLQVAPDIDPDALDPQVPIRDQYDFDSMDFLNFAIALAKEFQLNIPESDYPHLQSLQDTVDYLVRHTGEQDVSS
ncbi:acyl carrier protein [uncultured Microbulbifer sp.]|uniref:acyl carrier protein n=1 Tax=uncultured Microbulbifer sp. TaxID=348147 RepID=UPI0025E9CA5C|nr:phosphopantetheine-binding protein [uncultured Microbulbifer sp.]